jgi:hypothetical protein
VWSCLLRYTRLCSGLRVLVARLLWYCGLGITALTKHATQRIAYAYAYAVTLSVELLCLSFPNLKQQSPETHYKSRSDKS